MLFQTPMMKKVRFARTEHISSKKLKTNVSKNIAKMQTIPCPYVKIIDLAGYIEAIYGLGEMKDDPGFTVRFSYCWLSVHNKHIFSLYQAWDS